CPHHHPRHLPRLLLLALLAKPQEDGHEGGTDGVVRDHGADQVGQVERDRERRVDRAGADQGGGDGFTYQSRDAGDGGRGAEDRRGRGQTAGICHKRESLVGRRERSQRRLVKPWARAIVTPACPGPDPAPPWIWVQSSSAIICRPRGGAFLWRIQSSRRSGSGWRRGSVLRTCATAPRSRRCFGVSTRRSTRARSQRSATSTAG